MNSIRNSEVVEVKDVNAEFLPVLYDIVKCVEKDSSDAATKNKESLEAANRIQELSRRLEKAKEQVRNLPGIDLNPEEQLAQLASLRKQLSLKKELVEKYRSLGSVSNFLNMETSVNGSSSD